MLKPKYKSNKFECPICKVVSEQIWFSSQNAENIVLKIIKQDFLDYRTDIQSYQQESIKNYLDNSAYHAIKANLKNNIPTIFAIANCGVCPGISVWVNEIMVYPKHINVDPPNDDMSDEIKSIYVEAANILSDSPKGSSALLRLALQKLLIQVGKSGNNINNDIEELVREGLSPKIQQALDLVRVVGNEAVHPGQIDFNDGNDIALTIFRLINFIANELVSKPKELNSLYENIVPGDIKQHIATRDRLKS